jgi:hypothetical protein
MCTQRRSRHPPSSSSMPCLIARTCLAATGAARARLHLLTHTTKWTEWRAAARQRHCRPLVLCVKCAGPSSALTARPAPRRARVCACSKRRSDTEADSIAPVRLDSVGTQCVHRMHWATRALALAGDKLRTDRKTCATLCTRVCVEVRARTRRAGRTRTEGPVRALIDH